MRTAVLAACSLSLIVSGCIWGDRDFALSSIRLVEFSDEPPPFRLQLKVDFSTRANLPELTAEGYPLASWGYFCDRPDDFAPGLWGRVSVGDRPLGEVEIPQMHGPITYTTYIEVAREGVANSRPHQVGYDLRQHSEDVCFYVAGGLAPAPVRYNSNVVRIPKTEIEEALRGASAQSGAAR